MERSETDVIFYIYIMLSTQKNANFNSFEFVFVDSNYCKYHYGIKLIFFLFFLWRSWAYALASPMVSFFGMFYLLICIFKVFLKGQCHKIF